jgi:Icc protein
MGSTLRGDRGHRGRKQIRPSRNYFASSGNKNPRSRFSAAEVVTMKREIDMKHKNEGETAQETHEPKVLAGDGIDRRNFLQCMAWAGTGLVWSMVAGVPTSKLLADTANPGKKKIVEDFSFVQISDSHIGFNKAANQNVTGTLKIAIDKINAGRAGMKPPDFMIHTGDITQSSKPAEFDTAEQVIKDAKTGQVFYVPGEHDFSLDDGEQYKQRFGKGTLGNGWYSHNYKGVHFVGLNNCVQVGGLSASTPVVVFAHIPLWMVYEKWGWGTQDGATALSYTKRFGSVTVLNGHIHQIVQKVEGNVSFHTAMSTAFPQPAPGTAPGPGPMAVPAGRLESVLGVTNVKVVRGHNHLAVVDSSLAETV